ncbi:NADH-quinone oxidoreductase subunit J family protein [Enterobacteriaceae endosymbiont of Donacia semicuprea]|uniref:NADH-quinone oxidoreductase subunit J family protein n=1 Tax=Enterobacteriaceae endosymbiont of Donacia semicuprea TaxID=2675783 RepID=UPI001448DDF6|nr:NADH-quinone oxidoreductase subunit J [Enterobacteriaceae endosymbiont of Donacia semicuprea]QJC33015.1 NADH-quinone oxidoreductase subunit J [Enterobacteriaceae endosymbiont of Donacia semicuprea]
MEKIFYILEFISIIFTCFIIISVNPLYTLIYFLVSLISISCMFFLLGDYFAGSLEIIIYAGAIIILFIFVLMLLDYKKIELEEKYYLFKKLSLLIILIILTLLFLITIFYIFKNLCDKRYIIYHFINIKNIGINLFTKYKIIVELISILLLSSVIIVLHIGKQKR